MAAKYRYWLNSGKYSMMQRVAVLIFGLAGFMMLARKLEPSELGVWGLFLIISGIVETARNALIRNGYILFRNINDESKLPSIDSASLLINFLFTVLIIAALMTSGTLLAAALNAPLLDLVLSYYCITLILLLPFSQLEIQRIAALDFRTIFWMYFIRNGSFFTGIAILYLFEFNISLSLVAILFAVAAALGTLPFMIRTGFQGWNRFSWDRPLFFKYIQYGKFILGNNICSLIFRNTDSFLTASFISAAASAFYSSCTRITNFADMPSQVLGDLMFPKAAQVMRSGDIGQIKNLYEKTVAATLTFTLPIVAIVLILPKTILLVIAGEQYVSASGILQVIILYGLFLPFIRQFGNVMDVTGRPGINFWVLFVFAILNIVFNITGIYIWGLPGSAYGTLFSYFLLFLATYVILNRIIAIEFLKVIKNMLHLYLEYFKILKTFIYSILRKASYAK